MLCIFYHYFKNRNKKQMAKNQGEMKSQTLWKKNGRKAQLISEMNKNYGVSKGE